MEFRISRFEVLESTNKTAHQLAKDGAPEGCVIVADRQEQGRGRFGRDFFSPGGTGLYMSVILRPAISAQQALLITTAAAVAVAEAVEELTGESAAIKWVNDVYLRDKKVCGILTEGMVEGEVLHYAILGVGVNLAPPEGGFPADLADKAGALFEHPCDVRDSLAQSILSYFDRYYEQLSAKPFLDEYRRRSWLTGKTVQVLSVDGCPAETVTVLGIDEDFSLVVEGETGIRTLQSGDVSVKRNGPLG